MIDRVYRCQRCNQLFIAADGGERGRHCICGGPIEYDKATTLDRILSSDLALEDLADKIKEASS